MTEHTNGRVVMRGPRSRRGLLRMAAGGALAAGLPGCALPERGPPVPAGRASQASVLGVANERFLPTEGGGLMDAEFAAALERQRRSRGLATLAGMPPLQLLAVSGGGENGAFGAGLLCGWTEHGSRPVFDLVTGISTGALTAPFAFLGPRYDPQLRAVYTEIKPSEVLAKRSFTAALFDDALADNAPLFETISRYVDNAMLTDIAAAYDTGRLLLVVSTDLDAQIPVVWNIGAIAKSGHPRAVDTVRRILLASAAVPAAFPPTMIEVSLDGKTYHEMHVDGGTIAQAFLYPAALTASRRERMRAGKPVGAARAFIIRNGRLDPEWARVERRTLGIAGRAISTMIAVASVNDAIRIYNITQRDGIAYNLAYMGRDFNEALPEAFDPGYMRALFDYAYRQSRHGYPWATKPPIG